MHITPPRPLRAGFTLIELLTVIAIIGILAAIFVPTIGTVREKAQRAVDANNLREIAKAAIVYAGDNNDRLPDPSSSPAPSITGGEKLYVWAGLMAKSGALKDASLYFANSDPRAEGAPPSSVLDPADTTHNALNTDFVAKNLSVEVVGGLKLSDPATTPLAFTRGLTTSGTWDNNSDGTGKSVYGDTGGHIVFLTGNVQFFKDLGDATTGKLVQTNGKPTNDITKTIPGTGTQKIYGKGGLIGTLAGTAPTPAD